MKTRLGFSLVEVLLSLGIVALVMAALGPALVGTLRGQRQARAILEPLAREQAAFAVLREDLLAAPVPDPTDIDLLALPFTVQTGDVAGRRADTMQWCTCAALPMHPALAVREPDMGQSTVTWMLRESDEGQGLAWVRLRQQHLLATGIVPEPLEEIMLDGLAELEIEVYVGSAFQGTYDSSTNGDLLPSLVRISYAYVDTDGEAGPRRVVTLPVAQVGP